MAILKLRKNKSNSENLATQVVLKEMTGPVCVVGLFSFLISILVLVQPLYMMNLFDRVLTSLSVETLIALTAITLFLMVSLGFLEAIRSRALIRVGGRFDEVVGEEAFSAIVRANLQHRVGGASLSQVDQVRSFLSSTALTTFFDLPFVPIFLIVLYFLHPLLGAFALFSCAIIFIIGMSIEWFCKPRLRENGAQVNRARQFALTAAQNAEVVSALGMIGNLRRHWREEHNNAIDTQTKVSDIIADISGTLKASTIIVQICMLGLACYLVILGEATPGTMFAANVLAMRIVAPVQLAVSSWRSLSEARDAFRNIEKLLQTIPNSSDTKGLVLPAPEGRLGVHHVAYSVESSIGFQSILRGITFTVPSGTSLGIIGPSGSGKTTLAKLMLGILQPTSGHIRLDGADIYTWDFDDLGKHIGYVPQDVQLFSGTIAENICRFGDRDDSSIVSAAKLAGVHELILQLPEGYDTEISSKTGALSGGQRQRVAFARALYGNPKLLILDEPNSNLDSEGEKQLLKALRDLHERGDTTIVLITHNPKILQTMDKILVLRHGQIESKGDQQDVLSKLELVVGGAQPKRSSTLLEDTSANKPAKA